MIFRSNKNIIRSIFILGLSIALFSHVSFVSTASGIHHYATGSTVKDQYTGTYSGDISAPFSSDIDVSVTTSGGSEIVYDLDISWGTMMFEYDYGATWNPTTHAYQYTPGRVNSQQGGWILDDHVDSIHNEIRLINNSNFPMKTVFSYAPVPGVLNANSGLQGSVTGIFSSEIGSLESDESLLSEGVGGLRASTMTSGTLVLEMKSANLQSGEYYYYANSDDSSLSDQSMYFALSGTPDVGSPRSFTSSGKITISISPASQVTKKTK